MGIFDIIENKTTVKSHILYIYFKKRKNSISKMGNMLVPGVMTFPWLAGNELVLGDGHMLNPIRGTITEPDTTPECNDESTFDPQFGMGRTTKRKRTGYMD